MRLVLISFALLFQFSFSFAQKNLIIPEPFTYKFTEGKYFKVEQLRIFCQPEQKGLIQNFSLQLTIFGIKHIVLKKTKQKAANLILKISSKNRTSGSEDYLLNIAPKLIQITAPSDTGLFYGLQSLHQLAISNLLLRIYPKIFIRW